MNYENGLDHLKRKLADWGFDQSSEVFLDFAALERELRTSIDTERQYVFLGPSENERRERILRKLDYMAIAYVHTTFTDLCLAHPLRQAHTVPSQHNAEVAPNSSLQSWRSKPHAAEPITRYMDFDLHVMSSGYAVARSDQGESESVRIPHELLIQMRPDLDLVRERRTNRNELVELGKILYELLFPGPIHTHLQQTEAVARALGARVRLRVCIEYDALMSIPLELLYRKLGGYFMAINPSTALSRYLQVPLPPRRIHRADRPLHLLAILSAPQDQVRLDLDMWERTIRAALAKPLSEQTLTLKIVKHATRKKIRNALLEQSPNLIQFVGHGTFLNGRGYLALVDEIGSGTWLLDDERFANLILGHDEHLGLVCLTACDGAKSDSPQAFSGVAPQLVQKGVPAVVAMQYPILVRTGEIFLDEFYTSIAAGKPLDWSVQAARNAIAQELGLDNREFATPVLFSRTIDDVVFA
jgi:CHAT domain-containing protein